VRFRAVQVKVDGVWTRLGALTAWRWDLLDTDPPGWMRRGYTEVRGFWERGGGRTDDDDDGWLNA
jgi:hypothetical protein